MKKNCFMEKESQIVGNLISIFLLAMVLVVTLQIITRYVFFYSLPWSEELSRYLFIWLILFGACLGIYENREIKIDILDNLFPKKHYKWLLIGRYIVALGVQGLLLYSSIKLASFGVYQLSPGMQLPMWIVYSCFPAGISLMILNTLYRLGCLLFPSPGREQAEGRLSPALKNDEIPLERKK